MDSTQQSIFAQKATEVILRSSIDEIISESDRQSLQIEIETALVAMWQMGANEARKGFTGRE